MANSIETDDQERNLENLQKSLNLHKAVAYASSAILLMILGAVIFWIYMNKSQNTTPGGIQPIIFPTPTVFIQPTNTPPPPSITQPVAAVYPTDTPPVVSSKSDAQLLQEAFAKKYNRQASSYIITISKTDGTHISGGVKISGEMGGGWFLAYKQNGNIIIVQDGNGTISCEIIAPYNFPSDMVPECVTNNGKLVKR